MINSVNTLEFLKPKLITMNKFNSTTTTNKLLPPPSHSPSSFSQTRTFVTFGSHHHHNRSTIDINKQKEELINGEIHHQEERVKVQHLENHTKLQNNNCWNNFRTLCNNLSASSGIQSDDGEDHATKYCQINNDNDVLNVEHSGIVTAGTPITNNIQSKSAFNIDLNNMKYHKNTIYINKNNNNINNGLTRTETNNCNDQIYLKQCYNNYGIKQTSETPNTIMESRTIILPPQRTEDQNNAFRHIESVHNYAKLKSYEDEDNDDQSPHGSRHGSYLDDEEDDEENDEEEVDEEYLNGDIDYDERLDLSNEDYADDLDADYEDIFNRSQRRRLQKLSTSSDGALFTRVHKSRRVNDGFQKPTNFVHHHHMNVVTHNNKDNDDEEEAHIDIDVETVESQSSNTPVVDSINTTHHTVDDSSVLVKPDHHARRPMNAFLIFCKRHRAIVKERYKNLENRAITKILGDWWASLDNNDKKCFTNLAQQNKDAFFSANPNFKWYKLPAPPLRTLTTRPANGTGQDYQEEKVSGIHETISNNTRSVSHHSNSNFFKLADEAQMGDLSQLMREKSKATMQQQCADLQQALSETSQFMSTHITGTAETLMENNLKRRFYNENSVSSNSSEEDNMEPKKKSSRSCKGKRYQELINSGQIVTALKKSKSSARLSASTEAAANCELNLKQNFTNLNNNDNNFTNSNVCQKRSVSESDNIMSYEFNGFDLEERIKELPALDLDEYLQRKRNTKKKKKFSSNGKKRGQRSNNNNNSSLKNNNYNNCTQITQQLPTSNEKQYQQSKTAVGSQKRKARKESITRRDISVIEQEVAPLLPLTINGCCYYQEAPTAINFIKTLEKDTKSSSSIIPQQNPTTTQLSLASVDILKNDTNSNIKSNNSNNKNNNNGNILNDNISSSTSDLLILAEVAANRTELKH